MKTNFTKIRKSAVSGKYIFYVPWKDSFFTGSKRECENLAVEFEEMGRMFYLNQLRKIGIVLADISGGIVWRNEFTGARSCNVRDLVPRMDRQLASALNKLI